MNNYHFLVLGEEKRQQYLTSMLREAGHEVMAAEDYLPGYHDAILLPVPKTAEYLQKIIDKVQKGQTIYGCNFPEQEKQIAKERGIRFVDYMKEDGVACRNAVATAEGAIAEALHESCHTIQNAQVLVLGYGTCGAVLADKLSAWKADVTVADRKEEKRQRVKSYGYKAISLDSIKTAITSFDFIFNTIPARILTKDRLLYVKEDVVIIDIASRPGGTDFDYCRKEKINAKLCLGLPGKYAPKSAAGILMEVIKKTISGD